MHRKKYPRQNKTERPEKMQSRLIHILSVIFITSSVQAAPPNEACLKHWKDFQPALNDFKSVMSCGDQYSFQECRENLGLEGDALAVGFVAGAKAGRKITMKTPLSCSFKPTSSIINEFLLPASWAACGPNFSDLTGRMITTISDNQLAQKVEVSNQLLKKMAEQNPKLQSLVKDAVQLTFRTGNLSSSEKMRQLKEFAVRFEKETGLQFKAGGEIGYAAVGKNGMGAPLQGAEREMFIKIKTLESLEMPESMARVNQYDDLVDYFYNGKGVDYNDKMLSKLQKNVDNVKESKRIENELSKGLLKSESDVTHYLGRIESASHPAMHNRLSQLFAKAAESFPSNKNYATASSKFASSFDSFTSAVETKDSAGRLVKVPSGFMSWKKMAGPFVAAIASGGAMASECVGRNKEDRCNDAKEDLITGIQPLPLGELGCDAAYSRFSPVDDKCRPLSGFTKQLQSYVMADEQTQIEEFCSSSSLQASLTKAHDKIFPKTLKTYCSENKVTLRDDKTQTNSSFVFNGENLVNTTVRAEVGNNDYGYYLEFGSDSNVARGRVFTSRDPGSSRDYSQDGKSGASKDREVVMDDLAPRLVKAMIGRDCCVGRISGSDCDGVVGASNASPATSAGRAGTAR
jgi:hypothetical protein